MDIGTLDLFIETAQRLSFADVARARGLHPSAVSRAIQNLEEGVGTPLFVRTTRRMALSDAGHQFLGHAEAAVQSAKAAVEAAQSQAKEPSGAVRITASTAFGERLVVPLLEPIRERFPKIVVTLILSDEPLDLLDAGVDLALRLAPSLSGDMIGRKLFDTRYYVCASPDYLKRHPKPYVPADMAEHAVVTYDLPGYRDRWRFVSDAGEERVRIQPGAIITSALAVRRAVIAGLGPALLADWLIDDALASGALIDLFPDYRVTATDFQTAAWLAYPSASVMTTRVRSVADILIEGLTAPNQAWRVRR